MIVLFIYFCIAVTLIVLIRHTSQHYSRRGRIVNKIPGLPPLPILGNMISLAIIPGDPWPKLRYLFHKYDSLFRVWAPSYPGVFMCHPDDLQILLSCKKNINKSEVPYKYLKDCDVDGLISSGGSRWQHRRKILNYAFTSNHLEIYTEKVNLRAKKLVTGLKLRQDIFIDNIIPMLLKFSLAAVCDAVMDFDTDTMSEEDEKEFRNTVNDFFKVAAYRAMRPYILDFMLPFLSIGRTVAKVRKGFDDFRWKIINDRRKYHKSFEGDIYENIANNEMDNETNFVLNGLKKKLAVVDLLLLAEKKGLIDFHGIAEEVLIIAAAGYETTGMAIAYLLTLLAEHKEVQNLARAEISEILGDDKDITTKHVKQMEYLERCVKEALRLFPTAPHIGRTITSDIRLRKHTVPVGTRACMSLYDVHRNKNFWPEPLKFDPDRFLPENSKQRHPFAYVPFSAGPRGCIGQKFAISEMKLTAAHIIHNFYLEPVDVIAKLKLKIHFTIKASEIKLKFIKIKHE